MKGLIGITGGIGSGKSYVSRILRSLGYAVYDCDLEARRIMDSSCDIRAAISVRLGGECLLADGSIDRAALASRIFSDREAREWLNAVVHGAVRKDVRRWCAAGEESGCGRMFVESAILASSGLAGMCSAVWLVTAPEEVRIARVEKRNGLSREQVKARIDAQKEEEELLEKICGDGGCRLRIVDNSGVSPLLREVGAMLKKEN